MYKSDGARMNLGVKGGGKVGGRQLTPVSIRVQNPRH